MRQRIIAALGIAGLAATGLVACGDDSSSDSVAGSSGGEKVTIGIKFDQPGIGLKEGANYTGMDVDVARYVAKELGYNEDITFKESPSAQRETLLANGQVKMIFASYSITDARKEKVSFAGPYLTAGQDLLVKADSDITGPDSLNGKKLCSVTGSTSAQKVKDKFAKTVQLQEYDTYSKCVEALGAGAIDALTTDNTILAGYASQAANQGKFKVVGETFSTERYGVGLKKGDTETCTKVNDALKKMVDSGEWQKAFDKNLGSSGLKLDPATNPPKTFDACA